MQEAKQNFSQLVKRALAEGPQAVTRHGETVVVVVSAEDFQRLAGGKRDFITMEVADEWGRMNVPDAPPAVDALMAATAKAHGLTLVTRNTADLAGAGVRLLNPFDG